MECVRPGAALREVLGDSQCSEGAVVSALTIPLRCETIGKLSYIYGKEGDIVCIVDAEYGAEWIVTACNSHAALVDFVSDYIAAEDAAIAQWNKDYPRLPWKPDYEAMQRLSRARAALPVRS